MKKKLFKISLKIVLMTIVLFTAIRFSILTVSAQSLGAAHREFVSSSYTNTEGHTASSQWRVHDRANTGNFADDLKQEWQNLCDSFNFKPRDGSTSTSDMKPIDAVKPFIQNKLKENADNLDINNITDSIKNLGRENDSYKEAQENVHRSNSQSWNGDLGSLKDKAEGYINTAESIVTFTNSEHTHSFMRWSHYSLKGMSLGTSNIKQANSFDSVVSNMLDFIGDNVFTNYMNSHTNKPLDLLDGMTEYADNIVYKMINDTFTPQDIVGPGKDGSQGALTRPLPPVTENNNKFLRELKNIKELPKDIFNYFTKNFINDLGKLVNKSWNNLWKNISNLFKNDTKKKTGPGDARTLPVVETAIKPNIYLYPTIEEEVEVRFKTPELLETVIPEYDNLWKATAQPDGNLIVNGEKYGFLFYESDTSILYMQQDSGWIIKPETKEQQLNEIAKLYKFNEQETEDFVTFWCSRLENDISYFMYPQHIETIDILMPIDISPVPDSIFRVWFLFKPVSNSANIPTKPEIIPIERKGFTVTEWGGIVTKES